MEPYRGNPIDEEEGGDVVAVASYSTPVEAELSREHLAEHGITATVQESASFNPLVSLAAGGTRLLVRSNHEDRARELLRRLARAEPKEDEEPGQVRCPRCEQTYCTFGTALSTTSVGGPIPPVYMFVLLLAGLTRKRWRCQRCEYVWDDPEEGPKQRTPLHADDPQPVFKLVRRRSGSGLLIGAGLAFLLFVVASSQGSAASVPVMVLGLFLPVFGYTIGRASRQLVCSNPDCRAALGPDAKDCRGCHGAVAGTIQAAHEHWSEAAEVRRQLWALRQEEAKEKPRPRRKKQRPAPEPES